VKIHEIYARVGLGIRNKNGFKNGFISSLLAEFYPPPV
jgi:hypothetical protein